MYCMYFCICMHDARTFRLNGAIDHGLLEVRMCGISLILPLLESSSVRAFGHWQ